MLNQISVWTRLGFTPLFGEVQDPLAWRGLPYNSLNGEKPIDDWGTSLRAKDMCQFLPSHFIAFFSFSL
jgi:hypothetical protein